MSSKRRFRGGGRRFIQLYHNVKNSQAYYDLSVYAVHSSSYWPGTRVSTTA
jgi:hypothetical protein